MCMRNIQATFKLPGVDYTFCCTDDIGYKVYRTLPDNKVESLFQYTVYQIGVLLKDESMGKLSGSYDGSIPYDLGFHIFRRLEDASIVCTTHVI